VEVGDRVAKGDILAIMDQTQLHQAQIQLKNAETDFNRFDTLQKVGGIARQQYDQIKAAYDIAKSNVQFLSENTRLRAPFSGVVSGKYFENGELYSGAPNATGKAAIVSLVQLNPLKVMVSVSEQYFPQIKKGMEAIILCDIYPGKIFTGKVFRIYPTIDASTRTFMVEVETPNRDELLRPGMFTRVSFELDKVEALLVPALSILKVQGSDERYLFIVENGKAKRISIKPGQRIDDDVEVISNQLKTGDQIVIFGQTRLMDGTPVTVISE
jgi:RND family efflux transporter MFP subunit